MLQDIDRSWPKKETKRSKIKIELGNGDGWLNKCLLYLFSRKIVR